MVTTINVALVTQTTDWLLIVQPQLIGIGDEGIPIGVGSDTWVSH